MTCPLILATKMKVAAAEQDIVTLLGEQASRQVRVPTAELAAVPFDIHRNITTRDERSVPSHGSHVDDPVQNMGREITAFDEAARGAPRGADATIQNPPHHSASTAPGGGADGTSPRQATATRRETRSGAFATAGDWTDGSEARAPTDTENSRADDASLQYYKTDSNSEGGIAAQIRVSTDAGQFSDGNKLTFPVDRAASPGEIQTSSERLAVDMHLQLIQLSDMLRQLSSKSKEDFGQLNERLTTSDARLAELNARSTANLESLKANSDGLAELTASSAATFESLQANSDGLAELRGWRLE